MSDLKSEINKILWEICMNLGKVPLFCAEMKCDKCIVNKLKRKNEDK